MKHTYTSIKTTIEDTLTKLGTSANIDWRLKRDDIIQTGKLMLKTVFVGNVVRMK